MNQRALWMEQSLQAARMPLWTTLPICHVRTLGLLYWQLHGNREWALQEPSNLAFTLMRGDILTDAVLQGGGGHGKVTSLFLRTLPSWVWASYWPLWVNFSVFFRKHLTVVMSPTDSIAQGLSSAGSCESLPRNLLYHQWVDSSSFPLPWSQWLCHCTCVHVLDPIIIFSMSRMTFTRWLALSKFQFFKL